MCLFFFHALLFSILMLPCSANDCLLEDGHVITDGMSNSTLVSPGGVFELGFFTPDGDNNNSRYLGIWYHNQSNPRIVVWVANRDRPLLEFKGSLVIQHRKAMVLDTEGVNYWSIDGEQSMGPANSAPTFNGFNRTPPNEVLHLINYPVPPRSERSPPYDSTRNSTRLCLKDNGNLILDDIKTEHDPFLWRSFDHPTDTFLPEMSNDGSLNPTYNLSLTSWVNNNDPGTGIFTFKRQPGTSNVWVIVKEKEQSHYWDSGINPFDNNAKALTEVLFDNNTLTRLVMNFTGQIQFWKWEEERGWSLKWSEPKDRCSVFNICGEFASCNSNNEVLCKCLPGFEPNELWKSGHTSGGCKPISGYPNDRNDSGNDIFLQLPMMTVGTKSCTVSTDENCTAGCLHDSNNCVAYSYGSDCSGTNTSNETRCLLWNNELTDLQESPDGITIYVRTKHSDIDPTSRGCSPCGTYVIPYPLSTGRNCGDPSYFNFHCNDKTGQVQFSTPNRKFRVTSIDPDNKNFSIQVEHVSNCNRNYIDLHVFPLKDSLPFIYRNCRVVKDQPLFQVEQPTIEVEIGWKQPLEPTCSANSDCNHWPHATCKVTKGVKQEDRRCTCGSNYQWNGVKLECTRAPFPLKVVAPCIAGAVTVFLLCIIFFVYHTRKRRKAEGKGAFECKGDDTEVINVPFFDWDIILAATSNFADANRLGTGGFGSVYMGKLSDGHEIAVKRLSSASMQGVEEFRTEVKLIAKLQHRNLVRLIGYCMKADEKILVYEYMPNGSLDSCLFDERHSVYLDWKKRFDIMLGIARGLLYLHQDSRLRIIHRDLKPSNILLDGELNPKISDFGIARIVGGKETEASTCRVVGTYGYMSPEYASDGIFSVKSDVFSFGVVMLETISGRRNSKVFMFEHGLSLPGHAWKLWNEDKGLELRDPKLRESCYPSEVLKCIHIGLLCVQEDPSDRPTMSTVVHMMSGENTSLPLAKQPAFMNRKPLSENASSSSAMHSSVHEMMTVSTVGR